MSYVGVPSGKDRGESGGDHTTAADGTAWGADEFKSRRRAFENIYEQTGGAGGNKGYVG